MGKQGRLPGEGDIKARTDQKNRMSKGNMEGTVSRYKWRKRHGSVQFDYRPKFSVIWPFLLMKLSRDSRCLLVSMHRPISPVLDQPLVPMRTPMGTSQSPCDNLPLHPIIGFPCPQHLSPSLCSAVRLHPKWQQE